jgi:addiction module RelE/StbE family toxin
VDKKTTVNWTFSALEMLAEIHEYISERSHASAEKYINSLVEATDKLGQHPESCAPCRNPKLKSYGYRCCNVKNHIIIYEYIDETVNILAVIHSKRNPNDIDI